MSVSWATIRFGLFAALVVPLALLYLLVGLTTGGWSPAEGVGVAGFMLLVTLVTWIRTR